MELVSSRKGFFAKRTQRRFKRLLFLTVVDLQSPIDRFVIEHNAEPKVFTRTANPEESSRPADAGVSAGFHPLEGH